MTQNVLLLHGLHMTALVMKPLGNRLAAHGFTPHYFSYPNTKGSLKSQKPNRSARLAAAHFQAARQPPRAQGSLKRSSA